MCNLRPSLTKSALIGTTVIALCSGALALAGCAATAGHGAQPSQHARSSRPLKSEHAHAGRSGPAESPGFFSPSSFWRRSPAPSAPLDAQSPGIVAALDREVALEQAARSGPWINTTSYGVPILTVSADQATVPVTLDHAPDAALSSAWSAVPMPADARATNGSDGYLVVSQPSTDRMWEFWRLAHEGGRWHASWGGAIRHLSTDSGAYGPGAWPGAKPWWGATASSLALAGGVMTIGELRRGRIGHALAIAVPDVRGGVYASPARRTDGTSPDPLSLPEGARLRLDPHLDLSSLRMPPLTRAIAVAAQRYGIIVRDHAANIAFFGQDPTGTAGNPYAGASGFFEGEYPSQLLASFPWASLQVLKMDLHSNP